MTGASRKRTPARRKQPTVGQLIRGTAKRLRKAKLAFAHGTTDPVAEAAFLIAETLGVHPDRIDAQARKRVTAAQGTKIRRLTQQRIRTRKPAAYLVRRIYMRGIAFYIDERAIVPRSYIGEILDDELLAGEKFSLIRHPNRIKRILDLGTGSGCLAVLAALRFPNAKIDAVEISKDALGVAEKNVAMHGLKPRIRLLHGDLFGPVQAARYDLIIANPPYVDAKAMRALPPECRHEPRSALDGGADGLTVIKRILDDAGRHLTPRGGLLCEVGRGRKALERAYPDQQFLWLDTEESTGEVFWLEADQLSSPGRAKRESR